ncbi:hypothetical protein AB9G85_00010 [Escherichia coli]
MVKQLALDDFGIAMLSNSACKTELANGQLVPILQEWPIEPFKVYRGVFEPQTISHQYQRLLGLFRQTL